MKCSNCKHLFQLEPAPGISLAGAVLGLVAVLVGSGLFRHHLHAAVVIIVVGSAMLAWSLYQIAATMKAAHPACPKCGTALPVRPWSL